VANEATLPNTCYIAHTISTNYRYSLLVLTDLLTAVVPLLS
jgi:hypothetical protein